MFSTVMGLVLVDAAATSPEFLWRRVSPRPKIVCAAGGSAGVPSRIVHFLKRIGLPAFTTFRRETSRKTLPMGEAQKGSISYSVIALNKTSITRPPGKCKLCCVDGLFIRRVS